MKKNEHLENSIQELSQKLLAWLRLRSYSEAHCNRHRQIANQINEFMAINKIDEYNVEVGNAFLKDFLSENDVCDQHRKRISMIVYRLNDFNEAKTPPPRRTTIIEHYPLSKHFAAILNSYLNWCDTNGYKVSTIKAKSKFCGYFLLCLSKLGCVSIVEMKPEQICRVCLMFQDKNGWSHVRIFLRYLYDNSVVPCDYSQLVPYFRKPTVLPSVYSEKDIRRLEAAIERTNKTGIRDYAMLLLVTRYGLRAGDVAKLSFEELDFEHGRIRQIQEKTGKLWESAMLPEIKVALLDYINNARPRVNSDTVFLLLRAPFHGIGNSCLDYCMAVA